MKSKKFFLIVLSLTCMLFPDASDNSTGYTDTASIGGFKADSLKYGSVYKLGLYEDLDVDVFANDTSAAGYASDSVSFTWGIQTGHYYLSASGEVKIKWNLRIQVDSFHIASAIKKDTFAVVDTNFDWYYIKNIVDTTTDSYFAIQSDLVVPRWDVLFRTWYKGATGNKKGRFISLRELVIRRLESKSGKQWY